MRGQHAALVSSAQALSGGRLSRLQAAVTPALPAAGSVHAGASRARGGRADEVVCSADEDVPERVKAITSAAPRDR